MSSNYNANTWKWIEITLQAPEEGAGAEQVKQPVEGQGADETKVPIDQEYLDEYDQYAEGMHCNFSDPNLNFLCNLN